MGTKGEAGSPNLLLVVEPLKDLKNSDPRIMTVTHFCTFKESLWPPPVLDRSPDPVQSTQVLRAELRPRTRLHTRAGQALVSWDSKARAKLRVDSADLWFGA